MVFCYNDILYLRYICEYITVLVSMFLMTINIKMFIAYNIELDGFAGRLFIKYFKIICIYVHMCVHMCMFMNVYMCLHMYTCSQSFLFSI